MKIEQGFLGQEASVVALGSFDGVHKGHAQVLSLAAGYATSIAVPSVAICLMPPSHYELIEGEHLQQRHIELCGIDVCERVEFERYHEIGAEDFFYKVLLQTLGAKAITCGPDFRFGRGREGDVPLLSRLCKENNINLLVAQVCKFEDERISSTRIRNALKNGEISAVNAMLGRPYTIDFQVKKGFGMGEKLGFPTANQYWGEGFVVPKSGVYITTAMVDGKLYPSATGVTTRPSFSESSDISCETTIANQLPDLYGQKIEVCFYRYLFEPRKFNNSTDLSRMVSDVCKQSQIFFDEQNL